MLQQREITINDWNWNCRSDRLNYMEDDYFNVGDPRSEFPGNATPCNHRDWMNPQGIGFDANVDQEFHPVICVGAINDEAYNNDTSLESKHHIQTMVLN